MAGMLRRRRRTLDISIESLAKEVGLAESTVSRTERSLSHPRIRTTDALLKRLFVDVRYLCTSKHNVARKSCSLDNIPETLIYRRRQKHLSQADVSRQANEPPTTISAVEQGHNISLRAYFKVAYRLGFRPIALLER